MLTLIANEEDQGKTHDDALRDAFAVMTGNQA